MYIYDYIVLYIKNLYSTTASIRQAATRYMMHVDVYIVSIVCGLPQLVEIYKRPGLCVDLTLVSN